MKTTFDIPGNLFSDENRLEWSGKPILVARKTFAGESGHSVFFEIATAEDDYILTQLGEVVSLSDCQCWSPMPTPSFSLSGLPHEKPATTELAAEPRFNPAGPLYYHP
jgi:hypothetical protein